MERKLSNICWRQKPIDSLTPEELRAALGEAIVRLVDNGAPIRSDHFMLGLLAGMGVATAASLAALVLFFMA